MVGALLGVVIQTHSPPTLPRYSWIKGSRASWLLPGRLSRRNPKPTLQVELLPMITVEEQEGRAKPRRSPVGFPAFGQPRAQLLGDHLDPTDLGSFGTLEPGVGQRVIEPIVREEGLLG